MEWYRTCWSHLESDGMLEVRSGLDITRIKLRGMVLNWIAYEFCEVAQQNGSAVLDWDCLRDAFDLPDDGLLLVALTEAERIPLDSISDLIADHDEALWEATSIVDDWGRVLSTLANALAERERHDVLDALRFRFGGINELFRSMYGPSITELDAKSSKRCQLEDELDELEEDLLDSEGDVVRQETIRKQVFNIEKLLDDPAAIHKLILVDMNTECDRCNGDAIHRKSTYEWVASGCPIWIADIR